MQDTGEPTDWYSNDTATFGDRLAGARQALGMSQAELARRLGVRVKTLDGWERDLSEPRANRLNMLSGLLNVSFRWLLTGEGEGLGEPVEETTIPADVTAILNEMRQVRAEMVQQADRLGRLEKRLKLAVSEAAGAEGA